MFNSILVISGQQDIAYENLCSMELCLWLERFPPPADLEPMTTRVAV